MMRIENVMVRPVRLSDAEHVRDQCFTINTLEIVEAGIRQSHPLQSHRAEAAGLGVHPDFQGQGNDRKLVEAYQEKAQQLGISILEISCRVGEPAEQVYPRFGFKECGRLPRGLVEPRGERKVIDQVYFYLAVDE